MSTIYKFEDLLSFQNKELGNEDEFDAWDIFGKFDVNKKRLDILLENKDFIEKISTVLQVNIENEDEVRITGNTLDVINAILTELDKEENYTWPELASTCFFLGRNLEQIVSRINKSIQRKHSPHGEDLDVLELTMDNISVELEKLKEELELLRDAGII
jgi:hypothetical protein